METSCGSATCQENLPLCVTLKERRHRQKWDEPSSAKPARRNGHNIRRNQGVGRDEIFQRLARRGTREVWRGCDGFESAPRIRLSWMNLLFRLRFFRQASCPQLRRVPAENAAA